MMPELQTSLKRVKRKEKQGAKEITGRGRSWQGLSVEMLNGSVVLGRNQVLDGIRLQ